MPESKHDTPFTRQVPAPHEILPSHRSMMTTLMEATVANERGWHYEMVRPLPFPTLHTALHGEVESDCSFGYMILCKLADLPDPSGNHFQGVGNSVSLYNHLEHIPQSQALPGDAVVMGAQGRLHAMAIHKVGHDPSCWSHGQEKGPAFVPLSVEVQYHASRYRDGGLLTFLRMPKEGK